MAARQTMKETRTAETASRQRSRFTGILFTLISAVGFGITPMLASGVLGAGMDPIALAFWRCLLVVPVLLLLVLLTPGCGFRMGLRQVVQVAVLSLLGAVITGILLISSYDYLDTGSATTLNFTYPIFVLVLGGLFFHQRITAWDVGCFALCSAGIVLLCGFGGQLSWKGFGMALGSGITFGGYLMYLDQSRVMEKLHIVTFTFYYFLFGAVMLLPIVLLGGRLTFHLPAATWGQTVLYALLCGFLCTFALQLGVERIGSKLASILSTMEPVVTLVVGVTVLKENVTVLSWVGVALVIAAAILLTCRDSNDKENA